MKIEYNRWPTDGVMFWNSLFAQNAKEVVLFCLIVLVLGCTILKEYVLSDFIYLTQVHNFTVSAQDIFTFRRLSVFTVSFTGILQVLIR